jgi:transcriptional regulator with XRE-family HTH domain
MHNRVRYYRELRGYTLEQLAKKSRISLSQISKIETGERGYSVQSLEALARALGTTVGELLDVTDKIGGDGWQHVPVFGLVEAGGIVRPMATTKKRRNIKAPAVFGPMLALVVHSDKLYPRYTKGVTVFVAKETIDPFSAVGLECLVQTEIGESLLRTVAPGGSRNTFNLLLHTQPPELDCALVSCRPVIYAQAAVLA